METLGIFIFIVCLAAIGFSTMMFIGKITTALDLLIERLEKMKESEIEKKVSDYVKSQGGLCYKFTSPARRAVPDRIVILPGIPIFFIEFKASGECATPAQVREHTRLRKRGVDVYVVDDVDDGIALITWEMSRERLYT